MITQNKSNRQNKQKKKRIETQRKDKTRQLTFPSVAIELLLSMLSVKPSIKTNESEIARRIEKAFADVSVLGKELLKVALSHILRQITHKQAASTGELLIGRRRSRVFRLMLLRLLIVTSLILVIMMMRAVLVVAIAVVVIVSMMAVLMLLVLTATATAAAASSFLLLLILLLWRLLLVLILIS